MPLACALVLAAVLCQDEVALRVDAGALARADQPATATVALGPGLGASDVAAVFAGERHAVLCASDGSETPAQLAWHRPWSDEHDSVDVAFTVRGLAAGAVREYRLELRDGPGAAAFAFDVDGDVRRLRLGERALLEHDTTFDLARADETDKPILHLLHPGTGVRLTKGAGGEYPHHRGVFLGWSRTGVGGRTVDLWHCTEAAQRHAGYLAPLESTGAVFGRFAALTQWLDGDHAILANDVREVTVWAGGAGRTRIDIAVEIAADSALSLRGDPHHGGLQVRVAEEVAARKDATYVLPTAAAAGDDDVWRGGGWVAGMFTIAGERVAILQLRHPDNGEPHAWSTRDYGRFGAFVERDVDPAQPLRLRYRLVLWPLAADGEVTAADGDAERALWLHPPRVTVVRS